MLNLRFFYFLITLLLVGGCSVKPTPLTDAEIKTNVQQDKALLTNNQQGITRAISLSEAIARTLKYNLDLHLEMAERILAETTLDVSRYEMLPQLVVNSGYSGRSNFTGASSRSLLTGAQSLESSTSSDRDLIDSDVTLSWSVLDFGLSYVRAKQNADRVLIAEQERRKIILQLIQDVHAAYWRAVANERLLDRTVQLRGKVELALEASKEAETQRVTTPLEALTYQRELISIKRELQELQEGLTIAKIELASLMNLEPGEDYSLVIPERPKSVNKIVIAPETMEQLALEKRPELLTAAYEERINSEETRAAILELLPNLNLDFGKNFSSNSFLFNTNWLAYGAKVSWNLINVFKLPATQNEIDARGKLIQARRLALSMAILTQVHVALAQYEHAYLEYQTATEYFHTQTRIMTQVESGFSAKTVSEQNLIREEMNLLLADVKYDIAYSDLENSFANINTAIGMSLYPSEINDRSIYALTQEIDRYFEHMRINIHLFNVDSIQFDNEMTLPGFVETLEF